MTFEVIDNALAARDGDGMAETETKVAVVTGATSGIGAAIAEHFVQAGMHVVLTGRRKEAGQAVVDRLGDRASFVCADVGDDLAMSELIESTASRFGRIDCLVNNAGMPGQRAGLVELDLEHFDQVIATNLRAPLIATKAAAPLMINRRRGSVINICSVSGLRAGYSGHDYSTAKAALIHLTRSLAVEMAAHSVRVNSISPGPIATGIHATGTGSAATSDPVTAPFAEILPDNQPIPRAGVPVDVARAAVFLASDESSFVTGQDLAVDGGMSAGRPWKVYNRDWDVITNAAR